ncbi:hypothetical protein JF818_00395 [Sphaerochaeta sp. S2]|nr:hypothetical protein [Sphaerochaeta sp. S2]
MITCSNTPTIKLKAKTASILRTVSNTAEAGNIRSPAQTKRENTSIQNPKSKLVQLISERKK